VPPAQRVGNLLGVTFPFVGFVAAVILLWGRAVGAADLAVLAVGYAVSGIGVTVGFHRLLTHGAFRTWRPVRYLFALAGSLSVQGSVIDWVADHRMHHAHADEEGDYDNQGFRYRGHQFTDAEGRWRLETIVPAVYPGRTRHLHVKVQPTGGRLLTTQLYFPHEPENPRDGLFRDELVLRMSARGEGAFDFVVA